MCARSKTQRVNGGTSTAGRSYARSGVSGKGSNRSALEKDNEAVSNAMVVADDQESSAPTAEEESELPEDLQEAALAQKFDPFRC